MVSKDQLTDFVINENQDREWNSRYPPIQSVQIDKKNYFDKITIPDQENQIIVYTYLSGYIRRPLAMPGVYERRQATAVSKKRPKVRT